MKPATMKAIYDHAIEQYPRECCGVVIAVGRKEEYVPCQNIAETPEEHFVIAPKDLKAAGARGRVVFESARKTVINVELIQSITPKPSRK